MCTCARDHCARSANFDDKSCCRYADASEKAFGRRGFDRVRNTVIGDMDVNLRYFEEVYTTEHWLVRIYKMNSPASREPKLDNAARPKGLARAMRKPRTASGAP
jgi:dolichyl-diphosphooligosaccharide---protein glycosyltransferase